MRLVEKVEDFGVFHSPDYYYIGRIGLFQSIEILSI